MKTTIPSDVWESKKDEISNLYKVEEWPLKQVIKRVRSDGFDPTETQLRSRLKKWGVTKPSRQKRKKPTIQVSETKTVAVVEESQEKPAKKPASSPHQEISAHTDSDNSERWVYPPTPTQGYLLGSPASYLPNDQMQRGFSMRSSNIAVSDHGSPLHPMQQAAYSYDHNSNQTYGQAYPIPRSICDANIASPTINPPPQSFSPSQYPAGVSPHIQPHDRGPPKDSPSLLPPNSWGYTSSETSHLSFPNNGYTQVPNSPYIHPESGQPLIVDPNAALNSHYEDPATSCEKEPAESIMSLRTWKRASALVDGHGNFIGHARVTNRPPRLRRAKADGKSSPQRWENERMCADLQNESSTVMSPAIHPPLLDPSIHAPMQFSTSNGEYILPSAPRLDPNRR